MANVAEHIKAADAVICANIATLRSQRDLLSQNILGQLRNLVEGVAVRLQTGRGDVEYNYDAVEAEIAGHTDSLGDGGYNQSLSEERARVVRDYLVVRGVAAGRLTAAGYGESDPIADNDTEEGRERNRRVELRIR